MSDLPRDDLLSLSAHLPLDRRQALAQGIDLPERTWGSALFADLIGFTSLMEKLANTLGPRRGAEELTLLLNSLFTPLIAAVHGLGGSIVAFGGDALTCFFPGEPTETTPRAIAAALAMQQQVTSFETADLSRQAGPVVLSMHIGIASGIVRRFLVGHPPYGLRDVLAGAPIDRMVEAQHHAGSGQVAVDAATAALLPTKALDRSREGFAFVHEEAWPSLTAPRGAPTAFPALSPEQVRPWLAGPLYRRLRAGGGTFTAELRLVSSMFVQFNGLDYERDPDAGEKVQRYVSLAQEHLAPYEGHLAMVACGDKGSLMLILFGAPRSHEDDPSRAVGFAMAFREAVKALPFIRGQRTGISLGRVYAGILGSPQRCTYTVLGDEVNLSARLMQAAQMNQILVSRRVQQATAAHYLFSSLGTIALKGKERPAPIAEPTASRQDPLRYGEEQLVGRAEEWQIASGILDHVAAGRGHVLQIAGEAGVGKSAFVRTLMDHVQQRGWSTLSSTCLSYGRNTPYLPWRIILEQAAGLAPEMGPAEAIPFLEQKVAAIATPPDRPGYWRVRFPLLAEAMGWEIPDTALTRSLEGELRRDNTFQILEALLFHLAADRPTLFVLEDVHWADELSLALAGQIGRDLGNVSLLLLLTHRPFADPIPPAAQALQEPEDRTCLTLTVLPPESALELARQQLQGAELPRPLQELLQERAQGNPFFIEALLRALQEAGHLRHRADPAGRPTIELVGDWGALELPDTIEGIVRARMDRLPEGERLTLKVASVIGRIFQRPLLRQAHPAQPSQAALVRNLVFLGKADFIQLEQPSPEWRYAFRQTILHEVTYETLLFTQRRQLHGAIGAILEAWYAEDIPRVLDLLAYHYSRSEEREKAVHYLQQAGDKARREYANEVALGYYSQALDRLLPEEQERRYDILAGRERIYNLLGDRAAQAHDLQEMGRLAKIVGDPHRQVEVYNRQARRAADIGSFEQGQALAQTALGMAQQARNDTGEAEAHKILGILQASVGEYDSASDAFHQALEHYRTLGDRQGEFTCLSNLGLVHLYQGALDRALPFCQQALEMARRLADRRREGLLLVNLALAYHLQRDYHQARLYSEQAQAILQETGDLYGIEINLGTLGNVASAQGDLDAARDSYQQALELARQLEDPEGEATSLVSLGRLHIYAGELERARQQLRAALRNFHQIGHRRGKADALHYIGIVELYAGRNRRAQQILQQALDMRQEIGEMGNALVTQAWLALAAVARGQVPPARTHLEQILDQLEQQGYAGDYPEQEIWWAAYRVWQAGGEPARAASALQQAYHLVQQEAAHIPNRHWRQAFLDRIPVNRAIVQAHERAQPS